MRRQGAIRDGLGWYFAAFNRNKRSLTQPQGAARAGILRAAASGDGSTCKAEQKGGR